MRKYYFINDNTILVLLIPQMIDIVHVYQASLIIEYNRRDINYSNSYII